MSEQSLQEPVIQDGSASPQFTEIVRDNSESMVDGSLITTRPSERDHPPGLEARKHSRRTSGWHTGSDGGELAQKKKMFQEELIAKAISALQMAIEKGWTDFDHMKQDADLFQLRDLPEFKALFPKDEQIVENTGG